MYLRFESHQNNAPEFEPTVQRGADLSNPHVGGALSGVAECSAADRGKCDCADSGFTRERQCISVAGCQQLILSAVATAPDGPHRMDDEASGKAKSGRDPRFTRWTSNAGAYFRNATACFQQFRARRSVDRAINSSTSKQPLVRGVYDRVHSQRRDITQYDT